MAGKEPGRRPRDAAAIGAVAVGSDPAPPDPAPPPIVSYKTDAYPPPHVASSLSSFVDEDHKDINLYYNCCYIYFWANKRVSSHSRFVETIGIVRKMKTIGSAGIIPKNLNAGLIGYRELRRGER